MFREDYHIAGILRLQKWSLDGRLVEERTAHNDITQDGRNLVARLFDKNTSGDNTRRVSRMHLGKGGDAFDPAQKALVTEVGSTDITKTEVLQATDSSGKARALLRITGELGENDCNDVLREAGLFTDDNVMYNRVVFDTITKSNQFKLTLVWEIMF